MASVSVFVGLDYHDAAVRVCVLDPAGRQLANRDCPNDAGALAAFVHRHGRHVHAALESCPGAADLAEELVQRAGWSVDLAHPGFVARKKQNPDKTDCRDAQLLALLERVGYLPRVWLAPEPVREQRRLVRYRQQLAERRRATKLRVRAVLREHRRVAPAGLRPWTRAWCR
jgi:transposase